MPSKLHMTYVRDQKRWTKGYRGRTYSVSCRQLNAPPTKEQSWLAANNWWERKQSEIEAGERAARDTPEVLAARQLDRLADLTRPITGSTPTDAFVLASLYRTNPAAALQLELESPGRAAEALAALTIQPTGGRSVRQQADRWLDMLRAGRMNVATHRSYGYTIRRFVEWIGDGSDVSAITPAKYQEFWAYLSCRVGEQVWTEATANETIKAVRQFVTWLAELSLIPLPANLHSRRLSFSPPATEIITFTPDELAAVLAACTGRSHQTRLFVLLMLNCGMYQTDLAELSTDEVDWTNGTIKRERSKRAGKKDAQTVTYRLWPETLALLKQYRQDDKGVTNRRGKVCVLLTRDGSPLVGRRFDADKGAMASYDCFASRWRVVCRRLGWRKSPKCLRKTSATMLGEHPAYKFYAQHFLAHTPDTVADRHYVRPSQAEFDEAIMWLRDALKISTAVA